MAICFSAMFFSFLNNHGLRIPPYFPTSQLALDKKYEDGMRAQAAPGEMVTEVVEEFISIADGQVGRPLL